MQSQRTFKNNKELFQKKLGWPDFEHTNYYKSKYFPTWGEKQWKCTVFQPMNQARGKTFQILFFVFRMVLKFNELVYGILSKMILIFKEWWIMRRDPFKNEISTTFIWEIGIFLNKFSIHTYKYAAATRCPLLQKSIIHIDYLTTTEVTVRKKSINLFLSLLIQLENYI